MIYLPKNWKAEDGERISPLVGKGIWYGRVRAETRAGDHQGEGEDGGRHQEVIERNA